MDIRDRIITGSYAIGPQGKEPTLGWMDYAMKLERRYKECELLLERASWLVGNPGTGISGSTDVACDNWQKDFETFNKE